MRGPKRPQEPSFDRRTAGTFDHEGRLSDDESWDDELISQLGEKATTGLVVGFSTVGRGDERACVDDHVTPKPCV
jgi:hypothetical protein